MSGAPGLTALPAKPRVFLVLCIVAGVVTISVGSGLAASGPQMTMAQAAGLVALVAGIVIIQARAPSLAWRGRRIAVQPDEALLFLGACFVPPGFVLIGGTVAAIVSQLAQRKPRLKAGFNVATQAISTALALAAFVALSNFGVPRQQAALVIPFIVSLTNQSLVAGFLTLLAGEPLRSAARPELGTSILLTTIAGTTLGVLALALYGWQPIATLALIPAGYVLMRAIATEYRHQHELNARRALADASARLVAAPTELAIVEAFRPVCFDAFDATECRIVVNGGTDRSWTAPSVGGAVRTLTSELVASGGEVLGHVEVVVGWKDESKLSDDRALLHLIASYIALALASQRAVEARRRADRLESVNALVMGIAHEINNPVMYAAGSLELLELDIADAKERGTQLDLGHTTEAVRSAHAGLTRIGHIARALAQVSSSHAAKRAPFDARELLDPLATLGVRVDAGTRALTVDGNVRELTQALRALITNGIEAAGAGGVTVTARDEGAFVCIRVTDTGPGITAAARDHLFMPFFTTKSEGVGLGLTIAMRIARDHGGDILVGDGSPGATFELRLPKTAK